MKVYWTKGAESSFKDELDFIAKKWNEKEVIKFTILVARFLTTLERGILQGKPSKKKDVYISVISKQTSLIYKLENKNYYLLAFWNNKRNPKVAEKLLKDFS